MRKCVDRTGPDNIRIIEENKYIGRIAIARAWVYTKGLHTNPQTKSKGRGRVHSAVPVEPRQRRERTTTTQQESKRTMRRRHEFDLRRLIAVLELIHVAHRGRHA